MKKKTCLKRFYKTLPLFYGKNYEKKQLIFEKLDHFESWQKLPPSKGYSLCKMVTLGQKLKMQKTWLKRFYKTLQLIYAKNGSKKQLIFEK